MMASTVASKIDEVMTKASDALAHRRYFESERLCLKALMMARQASDFEAMSRIALPLQEARRQRVQLAIDHGLQVMPTQEITEESQIDPGCYLVRPPLVGADARRLRVAALTREVPVFVVCCEPVTQLGLAPVVAITPGLTLRTKMKTPKRGEDASIAWIVEAYETLGDWAIDMLDPELDPVKRVDALVQRLDALPEHEKLHQALADACRAAHRAALEDERAKDAKNALRPKPAATAE